MMFLSLSLRRKRKGDCMAKAVLIMDMPETLFRIQSATRRYARKQLTWFKKDPSIKWFDPNNIEEILNYIITNA